MKKLLISLLIILLLILTVYTIFNGIKIGSLNILGIMDIKDENEELDSRIQYATKLASTDYQKEMAELTDAGKQLDTQKKNYEDLVTVSTDEQVQTAKQFEKYKLEYLWTRIGNHARSEGVSIKIDVRKGTNTTQETYNLDFTVNGSYIGITDFIYAIEDDSSLGFKIEEFKMVPEGEELKATFICKDIAINDIEESLVTNESQGTTDGTTTQNGTNTTNTVTNNTVTTNTTNTVGNTRTNSTNNTTSTSNTTNSVQ